VTRGLPQEDYSRSEAGWIEPRWKIRGGCEKSEHWLNLTESALQVCLSHRWGIVASQPPLGKVFEGKELLLELLHWRRRRRQAAAAAAAAVCCARSSQ
jgi:hypothetical protein